MYSRRLLWLLGIILIVSSCKTVTHLADTNVNYLSTNSFYPTDKKLEKMIAPYKNELSAEMDKIIGTLDQNLEKTRPNSNLGNWFTDILLTEANKMFFKEVDIALQNYGGFRIPVVNKGPLKKGTIYELMPFDNHLVVVELDGHTMKELVDHMAESNGWPISRNLEFTISNRKATDILIKGKALDLNKTYRVALPDYVATGSGAAKFLSRFELEDSGVFIRDVVIAHLEGLQEENKEITIDNSERIH